MMIPIKSRDLRQWHPWLAWFPVPTQDGFWVWGRTIYRRDECSEAASGYCGPIWQWSTVEPDQQKENEMDPTALSSEQADLLAKIKASGESGLALSKRHPVADRLAQYGLITCRRSDNDTETWWLQ